MTLSHKMNSLRFTVLGIAMAATFSSCEKNEAPRLESKRDKASDRFFKDIPQPETAPLEDVDVNSLIKDPISADRSLPLPLLAVGETSTEEDAALAAALAVFGEAALSRDYSALEKFLDSFPTGVRSHAVRNNLAGLYYANGEFSKAYAMWNEAWETSKDLKTPMGKRLADEAFAGLSELFILFGRREDLTALLASVKTRHLSAPASELRVQAREALSSMDHWQEQAFKCGPFALFRIRHELGMEEPLHPLIEAEKSTVKGTSVAQLIDLSERIGMPMKAVDVPKDKPVPSPSVVYWKLGHYSAITSIDSNGDYVVQDTTFSKPIHISKEVMRNESSGIYLVMAEAAEDSGALVSNIRAEGIWGRMSPPRSDPEELGDDTPDGCKGMAGWSVGKLNTNLRIIDTPISYSPAVGPGVGFTVTFNSRISSQPTNPTYSNLGKNWTHNWLQFIQDNPSQPLADVGRQRISGGLETYRYYDGTTGFYALQPRSSSKLEKTGTASYILHYPNGGKAVFTKSDGTVSGTRRIFITKEIDPFGNELNFEYDAASRLTKLIDATGKETLLAYNYTPDPYRITSVTDPYGRVASLTYHASGKLASTTDTIEIKSEFFYEGDLELNKLKTPYGETLFETVLLNTKRQVTITDPKGFRSRYETVSWEPAAAGLPDGLTAQENVNPEVAVATTDYSTRVTYHWSEKQMYFHEGDYSKATQYFWMRSPVSSYVATEVLKAVRKPFVNMTFFKYPNQTALHLAGTLDKPITTATRLPNGQVQINRAEYNDWGLPAKLTDPIGRETLIDYDPSGQLAVKVRQKVASGYETLSEILTYNAALQPLQIKDAAGNLTTFTYNTRGQLATVTDHLGEAVTTTYQENTSLPGFARPLSISSSDGTSLTMTYDSLDRPLTSTDDEGYTVSFEYDLFDRLKKTTYPDGTNERMEYKYLDLVKQFDREGKVTEFSYNPKRQLQWSRDSLNRLTQYEWCLCGALQKLTDPAGKVTAWDWNIIGQNISKTYADGRTFTNTYDGSGRLSSTLDPKGQSTRVVYNLDNSIASKHYDNAVIATPSVSYAYDPYYPRSNSWTDALGTTTSTYLPVDGTTPGSGGIASVDGPWANDTITYLRDSTGRSTGYTLPGGGESFTYDSKQRIDTMTSVMGTTTRAYQGNSGRVLSSVSTSGPKVLMDYGTAADDFRLKEISNQTSTGAIISQHNYTFTADSQIATWNRTFGLGTSPPAETFSFTYDLADRLTNGVLKNTATGAVLADHQFIYDPLDNRVSIREQNSLKSGVFNNANQLTAENGGGKVRITGSANKAGAGVTVAGKAAAVHPNGGFAVEVNAAEGANHLPLVVTEADGTVTTKYVDVVFDQAEPLIYTYDANGNLETVAKALTPTSPTSSYEWDAADQLVAMVRVISPSETRRTEFLYDGGGSRVGKKEFLNGSLQSEIKYIYGGTGVLQERSADGGTVLKTYTSRGELDYTTTPPTPRYFTRDHLGSVREVVADDGSLLARYDYKPYGERVLISGTYEATKGFTGHDYLPESGMILTRYRAYDPLTGRWLSPDPIQEAGGMNLYGYVGGDPVNAVDPLGLASDARNAMAAAALWGVAWGAGGGLAEQAIEDAGAANTARNCGASDMIPDLMSSPGEYLKKAAIGGAIGGVTGGAGRAVSGIIGKVIARRAAAAANRITNSVPSTMARVIPEGIPATTLGRPGAADVFVTAADDIAGMNASQIANRLSIPQSPTGFKVFEFPTPQSGVASPVFRTDPGFIGGGRTAGGAREFVIPNGTIPPGSVRRVP